VWCSRPWRLISHAPDRVRLRLLEPSPVQVKIAAGYHCLVQGQARVLDTACRQGGVTRLELDVEGEFEFSGSFPSAPLNSREMVSPVPPSRTDVLDSQPATAPRGTGAPEPTRHPLTHHATTSVTRPMESSK